MIPVGDEVVVSAYFKCHVGEYIPGFFGTVVPKFSIHESRLYVTDRRIVLEPEHSFTTTELQLKNAVITVVSHIFAANPLLKAWYADLETYHPNNQVISIPRVTVKNHETIEATFGHKNVVAIFFGDGCIPVKMLNRDAKASALTDIVTVWPAHFGPPESQYAPWVEKLSRGAFDYEMNCSYVWDIKTSAPSGSDVFNPASVFSALVAMDERKDPCCLCCRHFAAPRGVGYVGSWLGKVFAVATAARNSCTKCALTGLWLDLARAENAEETGAGCENFQTIVPESYDGLPQVSVTTLGASML